MKTSTPQIHLFFFLHPPGQKHRLGLWEAAGRHGKEGMAAQVGVIVVGVVWTVLVILLVVVVSSTFTVHGPEEPQDEHEHPQHHAAEGECLQAALVRSQEGCGASGHDEEGSDEDGSVV